MTMLVARIVGACLTFVVIVVVFWVTARHAWEKAKVRNEHPQVTKQQKIVCPYTDPIKCFGYGLGQGLGEATKP